jgi:hypothetical protein
LLAWLTIFPWPSKTLDPQSFRMIPLALIRFFGMAQISSVGFLPPSIWTKYFGLGHEE